MGRWRQGLVLLVQVMMLLIVFSSTRMVLCSVTSLGALSQTDQFLNERESAVRSLAQNVLDLALDTTDCGTFLFHSTLSFAPQILYLASMSSIVLRRFRDSGNVVIHPSARTFFKGVTEY